MRSKEKPTDDGKERLGCPASGANPLVACPHKPKSMQPRIVEVKVVDDVPFARVASDHSPVMVKLKVD